jgi:hypothetical protein
MKILSEKRLLWWHQWKSIYDQRSTCHIHIGWYDSHARIFSPLSHSSLMNIHLIHRYLDIYTDIEIQTSIKAHAKLLVAKWGIIKNLVKNFPWYQYYHAKLLNWANKIGTTFGWKFRNIVKYVLLF